MPPLRPTLDTSQLSAYFQHINLPTHLRSAHISGGPTLSFLRTVQRHQLASIPWENLSKHYSPYNTPVTAVLNHEELLKKIVGSGKGRVDGWRGGRGGGCLENNGFFGSVLRGLGYKVTSGGGRVCVPGSGGREWSGWEHMINLISLNGQKYICDVGFGANGQTAPLPLIDGQEHPHIGPTAKVRLIKAALPIHTDPDQRLWIYQLKKQEGEEWESVYAFSEMEFLPQDYESMTVGTTYRRNSFFAWSVAVARMVMRREVRVAEVPRTKVDNPPSGRRGEVDGGEKTGEVGDDEIIGVLTLTDTECKRRILGGEPEVMKTFEKEQDRLDALKMYFGIGFSEAEKTGVLGTVVGLRV